MRCALAFVLAIMVLLAYPALFAHAGSGLEAVVYSDGSVRIEGSIHTTIPGIKVGNCFAKISGYAENEFLSLRAFVNSSVELRKPLTDVVLSLSSSYSFTEHGYRIMASSNLFENLSREGWIRALANVTSAFDRRTLVRHDNVSLIMVAHGKMSDVIRASVFLNPLILQSQLRSAGITWVRVLEARSSLINSSAAHVVIRLEINVSKMLRERPGLRSGVVLNPPRVSMSLEMVLRASGSVGSAKVSLVGRGDVRRLGDVIDQALLLPTVGAGGSPVAIPMVKPVAEALSNASLILASLPWLRVVPSNFSLVIEVRGDNAVIQISTPRFKAVGSNDPMTALSLLAYGLKESEKIVSPWMRSVIEALLSSEMRIVPMGPGITVPVRSATLRELARAVTVTSPRTISVTVSVTRSPLPSTTPRSSTVAVQHQTSYSYARSSTQLSTKSPAGGGWWTAMVLSISAVAVGTAILAVVIAIYAKRR